MVVLATTFDYTEADLMSATSIRIPLAMLEQLDKARAGAFRSRSQQILWYIAEGLRREAAPFEGAVVPLRPTPTLALAPLAATIQFDDAYRELDDLLAVAERDTTPATVEEVEHAFDRAGDREREEATTPGRAAEMTAQMDAAHVRLSRLRNTLKARRT